MRQNWLYFVLLFFVLLFFSFPTLSPALPYSALPHPALLPPAVSGPALPLYGATFSYSIIAKEPLTLRGAQLMLVYDPQTIRCKQFNVYFDGGFSHYRNNGLPYHTNLNIYSIAPVVRYTFKTVAPLHPYFELSIGLAYLNHTYIGKRNLGIHFAFQDRLGIGIYTGTRRQFSLGIHSVHYSNAHFSKRNSGVTVPIELDLGYRFS